MLGVGAVGIGAGPAHALYFSAYEFSKSMFGANDDPGHEHIATGETGNCHMRVVNTTPGLPYSDMISFSFY